MTNINLTKEQREHLIGTLTEKLSLLWKDIKFKRDMISSLDDANRIATLDKLIEAEEKRYTETLDLISSLMERD